MTFATLNLKCRAERSTLKQRQLAVLRFSIARQHNGGLQLRRAISIQAEGMKLLEKHAIAPSAARLCYLPTSRETRIPQCL